MKTRHTLFCMSLILIIIFSALYGVTKNETFSSDKKIILYNFLYGNKTVSYNEIFPLKKYKCYHKQLNGPNKLTTLDNLYTKEDKNYMLWGIRKYEQNRQLFKITDFSPAPLTGENNPYSLCTKDTKRCEFWKKKNYFTPSCCAKHLTELLFYITDLFDKNNIEYFIYYGTLLGCLRHKGLIPWDTDVDLYINLNSMDKLKKLQNSIHQNTHYRLNISGSKKHPSRLSYSKINKIHVDIYYYAEMK